MKNHWLEEKEAENTENLPCTNAKEPVTIWAGRKIEIIEGDFEFTKESRSD